MSTEKVRPRNTRTTTEPFLPLPVQFLRGIRRTHSSPGRPTPRQVPSFASIKYPGFSEDVYTIENICYQRPQKKKRIPPRIHTRPRGKDIVTIFFTVLLVLTVACIIAFLYIILRAWWHRTCLSKPLGEPGCPCVNNTNTTSTTSTRVSATAVSTIVEIAQGPTLAPPG
jgi:hypothetical protein